MIYLTILSVASLAALSYAVRVLAGLVTEERERAADERQGLLQRIQAPETAVAVQAQADMDEWDPPKLHIAFDADKEFTDYENGSADD